MKRNTVTAVAAAALVGLAWPGLAQQGTTGTGTTGTGTTGTGSAGAGTMGAGTTGTDATMGTGMAGSSMASTISPADHLFLTRAADGNMAEIMTSKMALKKAENAETKTVAQMLITEHGTAQDDLVKLAGQKGVLLPPMLGPTHQIVSMILSKDSGDKFDKDFLGAQVEDHENTIALFQQEVASGQDPDVKAYASQYLPKIVGHTTMIYGAAEGVGVMAMKFRPTTPPMAMPGMTTMTTVGGGTTTTTTTP